MIERWVKKHNNVRPHSSLQAANPPRSKKFASLDYCKSNRHRSHHDSEKSKEDAPKSWVSDKSGSHTGEAISLHKEALAGAKANPQANNRYGQHDQKGKEEIDPIGLRCILPDCTEKNHPQTNNHKRAAENGKHPTRCVYLRWVGGNQAEGNCQHQKTHHYCDDACEITRATLGRKIALRHFFLSARFAIRIRFLPKSALKPHF